MIANRIINTTRTDVTIVSTRLYCIENGSDADATDVDGTDAADADDVEALDDGAVVVVVVVVAVSKTLSASNVMLSSLSSSS